MALVKVWMWVSMSLGRVVVSMGWSFGGALDYSRGSIGDKGGRGKEQTYCILTAINTTTTVYEILPTA